jgi:hypothetical protein
VPALNFILSNVALIWNRWTSNVRLGSILFMNVCDGQQAMFFFSLPNCTLTLTTAGAQLPHAC